MAIGLGIGYVTYLFGLSFAFGAFVAGMVLSESDYGHQALSEIIPLRDIFGLLFFTSVGMLLDPIFFLENGGKIVSLLVIVSFFKGTIFYGLASVFGYINIIPIAKQALLLNPSLQIIARAEGVAQTRELYDMGVYMVVLPEMETGLEIARQALVQLEIPVTAIQQYIDGVHRQLYAPIYDSTQAHQLLTKLDNIKDMLEIS